MADADDVRCLALALPHVEEIDSDGFDFRVGGKGFVWSYPDREPGGRRVIRTDVAVLFVGDEAEKQALLLGEPGLFFTTPAYDGWPLVMLRLAEVGVERLSELVTDAWRMRAPATLAGELTEDGGPAEAPRLRPFPAGLASVVSGWATTDEEVLMWCGQATAPVQPAQVSAWASEDGVEPFGLYRGERLVAYGELWVDDGEAEVELGRLIVDPTQRGQGIGRCLAAGLASLARSRHPQVFLRVHPDNTAAQRCYAGAGFEPTDPDRAAAWNLGQPVEYVWLTFPR